MGPFEWLFLIGRVLFSALFIFGGLGHFMQLDKMSQYAGSKGVPAPKALTLLTGLAIILGGLSILLWTQIVVGAWLLAGFLLLAAFTMHDFWAVEDAQQADVEMQQFMKNLALAGAAVVFYALAQVSRDPDLVMKVFG